MEWRYSSTSTLHGDEWSAYALAALPQRKEPTLPLDRRLGGPQSRSDHCGEEKNLLSGSNLGRPASIPPLYQLSYRMCSVGNSESIVKVTDLNCDWMDMTHMRRATNVARSLVEVTLIASVWDKTRRPCFRAMSCMAADPLCEFKAVRGWPTDRFDLRNSHSRLFLFAKFGTNRQY
jgi:hypothetical protein